MKMSLFISLIFIITLSSCNTEAAKKKKETQLMEEVMAIHDEVMPQMDQIFKLRKELKSLNNQYVEDTLKMKGFDVRKSQEIIVMLDSSDKIMMDWMHTYNGGQGLYSHEEVMKYLEEEKVKITHVKDFTFQSIESAKKFLNK